MERLNRVLFVCTGNVCRSPMAEGALKFLLQKEGLAGVNVSSAGTHGLEGRGAEGFAISVCGSKGIDISEHRARILTRDMIQGSDLIVVMEQEHGEWVWTLCPEARKRTRRLTSFFDDPAGGGFIADPYGLPEWAYEACFAKIERNVKGLFRGTLHAGCHEE